MSSRACIMVLWTIAVSVSASRPAAAGFDLAAAIEATDAGGVIEVPVGIYRGQFVINKPLTLIGPERPILDGGGDGDVIKVTAPDVTIRGFLIRNTGISLDRENAGITVLAPRVVIEDNVLRDVLFGIYLKGAESSVIRGNDIGGKNLPVQRRGDGIRIWQSHETVIEDNVVTDSRDAVIWFSDGVELRRNRITNGRYGLHFMYSDGNVLEENHLEGNSVGAFLMYSKNLTLRRNVCIGNRGPSGYGVGLKDMDNTVAEDNLFVGNRIGLQFDNSPSSMRVHDVYRRNVFAYNDIGVAFLPSVKRNSLTDNTFLENIEQVAILGRGDFRGNHFAVDDRGNFWSDYRGYDLDGDGIGDIPHKAWSLFENLIDREPKLRLFLYSPSQQAIEMASRAFPIVRPEAKFTDTAPLMQPVLGAVELRRGGAPWPIAATAAVMLGASAVVLLIGARPFQITERAASPDAAIGGVE
ncbi:MAG: nitrous oxide reductase family maturation protein NosD [Planctomycetota bacterium]|nr:nitrous oxide reductase family maturation protein NosD [Planctomycetota bacterium]